MKKTVSLLVAALVLLFALTGCDSIPGKGESSSPSPSDSASPSNSTSPSPSDSPSPAADPLSEGEYEEGGEEGYLGEVLHTYWFNYMIDEAYTCATYGDYTAPEGKQLLVLHMALKNTSRSSTEMYDTDFMCFWDDEAEDAYSYPITTDEPYENQPQVDHQLSEKQFTPAYTIPINGTVDGELVYEVPTQLPDGRDNKDFVIVFVEQFSNEDVGDYYYTSFTPEAR